MAKKDQPIGVSEEMAMRRLTPSPEAVGHVVVRKFVAYGVKLNQGVRVDASSWPKLLPLMNAKFLRPATVADMDRKLVEVPASP